MYDALAKGDVALTQNIYGKKIVPNYDIVSKYINDFSKIHIESARTEILELIKTKPIYISIGLSLLSIAVTILTALWISTYLGRVTKLTSNTIKTLAKGDFSQKIKMLENHDEFGALLFNLEKCVLILVSFSQRSRNLPSRLRRTFVSPLNQVKRFLMQQKKLKVEL